MAAYDDCDLQSVIDDGLLHSFAMEVEKDNSAQVLGQLLSQSQLALGKLSVIFYMAGWSAHSVAQFMRCADCNEAVFLTNPFMPTLVA